MTEAGIAQGSLGFLLYLAMVPLLLRACRGVAPSALVLAAAIALWLLTLIGFLAAGRAVNIWTYSVSYGFFVLCFLMVFGAIHKSISLRLLDDLLARPDRSDTYDALVARVIDGSYRERLEIIQDKEFAARYDDRFVLTARGRRIAGSLRVVQRVYGIARSG